MSKWMSFLWFLMLPISVWGQSNTDTNESQIDCINSPLPISNTDFVRQQIAADSVASLLVGHWKLIRVESGWSAPKTPDWLTELFIDQQGRCVVRTQGNWVSGFQLAVTMQWGCFLFTVSQQKGASFLHFSNPYRQRYRRPERPNPGRIYLCGTKLSMSDNSADGHRYLYERVTTAEPDVAFLTPVTCQDSLLRVASLQRVKGIVQFREDAHAYVIDYSLVKVSGTVTNWIGIICNWPQAKEYVGKTVAYSGTYFTVPGEQKVPKKTEAVYYLRLTGFHPVE